MKEEDKVDKVSQVARTMKPRGPRDQSVSLSRF
jgi:hypothetical protein